MIYWLVLKIGFSSEFTLMTQKWMETSSKIRKTKNREELIKSQVIRNQFDEEKSLKQSFWVQMGKINYKNLKKLLWFENEVHFISKRRKFRGRNFRFRSFGCDEPQFYIFWSPPKIGLSNIIWMSGLLWLIKWCIYTCTWITVVPPIPSWDSQLQGLGHSRSSRIECILWIISH